MPLTNLARHARSKQSAVTSTWRANRALAAAFRINAESLGRVFIDPASVPIEAAGSTDMGNVSHVLPVIHPVLDVGTRCAGHTIEMTAAAITPAADQCILDAAKAMAATVIDYWTQPDLRDRVATEWAARDIRS